jgi:hypothetical protein
MFMKPGIVGHMLLLNWGSFGVNGAAPAPDTGAAMANAAVAASAATERCLMDNMVDVSFRGAAAAAHRR